MGDTAIIAILERDGAPKTLRFATGESLTYSDSLSCTQLIARGAVIAQAQGSQGTD